MTIAIAEIKFDEQGLLPVIVQDANTLQVLTLAYMNAESLRRTLETNETWFWSRSRSSLWHKGEIFGNKQRVVDVTVDCDHDAIRILLYPKAQPVTLARNPAFTTNSGCTGEWRIRKPRQIWA